jgi:hypothetical protein
MARHVTFTVRLHREERHLLTEIAGLLARNESETVRWMISQAAHALRVDAIHQGAAASTTHIVVVDRRSRHSEVDDER